MMNTNTFSGMAIGWHIHIFFVLLILIGLALLITWAGKALSKKQLLSWTIYSIIAGLIGMFLTMNWGMMGESDHHEWSESHGEINSIDELNEHMQEEMSDGMGFNE